MSPKNRQTGGNRRAGTVSDDAARDTTKTDETTEERVDEPDTDTATDASTDSDTGDTDTDKKPESVKTRTVPARKRRADDSGSSATKESKGDSKSDSNSKDAKSTAKGKDTVKAGAGKAGSTRSDVRKGGKPAGKPARGRKPGGRKPVAPVRVSKSRPWGMIAMFTAVILIFVGIVGYTGWQAYVENLSLPEKARRIDGLVDYRSKKDVKWLTRNHKPGKLQYQTTPPVGGDHNSAWQDCTGKVYKQQIPNEHAVHSLEHGAVWITYRPDLPAADIAKLARKVEGKDYMMMSPYPGQEKRISLQAWGFQLQLDSADDPRIDEFITTLRLKANVEPGATCSGGVTQTGTEPVDDAQNTM